MQAAVWMSRSLAKVAASLLLSALSGVLVFVAFAQSSDPPVVKTRRALDRLARAALDWQNRFDCSGCHKQAMPLAAAAAARRSGYEDMKPGTVDALSEMLVEGTNGQQADGCFPLNGGNSSTVGTTWGGRGLEAYSRAFGDARQANLLRAADCLLGLQAADGRLASDHTELPPAQGDFVTTAHGIFVWNRAAELTGDPAYADAAARAEAWLRGRIATIEAAPSSFTTQDKAMLLAGLAQAGATSSDGDVVRMHDLLASEQQPDGSWKLSHASAGGNAHGTGQVVFAMRAAGYDRSDPAVDRGTAWLLDRQSADGSWPADFWQGNPPSGVAPSMWAALALATFPSPLNRLRVAGGADAVISWEAVEGAEAYDLIRGVLDAVVELEDRVDLGSATCLASATGALSVADPATPAAGQAFFYVMRIRWATSHDIYGRSSRGLDRVPASGDCPP